MALNVSPGVYAREIGFPLYTPAGATSVAAFVGSASKGPLDDPTLITDTGSLVDTFGAPSPDHLALYAAQSYLMSGNQLWYVRVASYGVSTATGALQDSGSDVVTLTAASSGTWGNSLEVIVGNGSASGTYKLTVKYNGYPVEAYDLIVLGSGNSGDDNYIETRISGVSDYISVTDGGTTTTLDTGTFSFSGGANGTPVDASDVIGFVGTPPAVPASGLKCFSHNEERSLDFVAVPGRTENSVVSALITLAEDRGDCIALIDPPSGLTVEQVIEWHNGDSGLADAPTSALNSSYAALYYPWATSFDSYNNVEVTVPPSGLAAQVMARTDYVANVWNAPAGLERGVVLGITDIEYSATQGDRDYMYNSTNSVNPICKPYENSPWVIWGQRTLLRTPTPTNRINVRRTMLYLRNIVVEAAKGILFQPNNARTRQRLIGLISPTCDRLKSDEALYDYRIVCDATNNPPSVVDNNELRAKILVKPTATAEIITLDFVVLPSGVDFSDY